MNVLLLMVALAIPVEAPKAGLSEAAAASAAVAREVVLVEGGSVLAARAAEQVLMEKALLVQAAGAPLPLLVDGATFVQAARAPLPLLVDEVRGAGAAAPRPQSVFPSGTEDGGCSLGTMYERMRFLSGPWGAWRRLKAARIRGDTAEAERMKALLDRFVIDALEGEES